MINLTTFSVTGNFEKKNREEKMRSFCLIYLLVDHRIFKLFLNRCAFFDSVIFCDSDIDLFCKAFLLF
jgi:hypothetical protein